MWRQLIRKHPGDEELLAHVDGELPLLKATSVRRHLYACWECRNRLHELETQTRVISRALAGGASAGAARMEQAKNQFLHWRWQFERSLVAPPRLQVENRRAPRARVWALAAVFAVCFVLTGWLQSRRIAPDAPEILLRTAGAEEEAFKTPLLVRQTFGVRLKQIAPEQAERRGKIEIWSDNSGRRYASRWHDSDGQLRHAVWHPGDGEEFLYNPSKAPSVVLTGQSVKEGLSLADLSRFSLNVEELESGLMTWLENRQWRPVTFGSELQAFASEDGVILRTMSVPSGVCVQAERTIGPLRMQVTLELNEELYTPRLQRIRFEADGRVMELELTTEQCEFLTAERASKDVFEPAPSLLAARLEPRPPDMAASVTRFESDAAASALASLEIEVRYALHSVGACLGEPVRVVRREGLIEVQGVARDQVRKEELRSVLEEISGVRVNIKTIDEALAETASVESAETAMVALETPAISATSGGLPIQERLERFLAGRSGGIQPSLPSTVAEFSTRAVTMSQQGLAHAWALRRLAENYREDAAVRSQPTSRWLLEAMVRDHVMALDGEVRQVRALLEPLFFEGQDRPVIAYDWLPLRPGQMAADWKTMVPVLFDLTNRMDVLVRALFAGADFSQEPPFETPRVDQDCAIEEAACDLRDVLSQIDTEFERLASQGSPRQRAYDIATP